MRHTPLSSPLGLYLNKEVTRWPTIQRLLLSAYHSETLAEAKVNYSTYDKEFYSLVQALKQWRHYILGKETILHTDHHPLIFINSQSKIQEQRHLKWATYIQ